MKGPRAEDFERKLSARIVGQERAVHRFSNLFQVFLAGMSPADRPIGTMLFLGPTGSGKTRAVEAAAEILFGNPHAVIKIDCAEFQHSHEIAKLIGSPPGYLGHRETSPLMTQLNLVQVGAENIPVEQLSESKLKEKDPLKAFSVVCRRELKGLQMDIGLGTKS
jgi:DNA polymerase III delta prime subunit